MLTCFQQKSDSFLETSPCFTAVFFCFWSHGGNIQPKEVIMANSEQHQQLLWMCLCSLARASSGSWETASAAFIHWCSVKKIRVRTKTQTQMTSAVHKLTIRLRHDHKQTAGACTVCYIFIRDTKDPKQPHLQWHGTTLCTLVRCIRVLSFCVRF